MTAPRFAGLPLVGATIAIALALAGCTPSAPAPEESTTPSASHSSPAPTATATATPTPTAEPSAASCETLLDLSTLEAILKDGFDVYPANDYIEKIRAEGSPLALFDEYGGLLCPVNNGTRVSELYAYSAITPDQQAVQEARLISEGFTASEVDGGTLYELPNAQDGIVYAFYFRNGFWWCGYDAGIIEMIVANSPES